jgi:hypothetical protein
LIIRQVALEVVPGLLQTEEYTRALLAAYRMDPDFADKLVESRKERREVFDRPQPPVTFSSSTSRCCVGPSAAPG